jgi:hypothetical protein
VCLIPENCIFFLLIPQEVTKTIGFLSFPLRPVLWLWVPLRWNLYRVLLVCSNGVGERDAEDKVLAPRRLRHSYTYVPQD